MSTSSLYVEKCKCQYKNVGLTQNKHVGKPTFLFCVFSTKPLLISIVVGLSFDKKDHLYLLQMNGVINGLVKH